MLIICSSSTTVSPLLYIVAIGTRTKIVRAVIIGALVPVFWGCLGFILFNANGRWTDFYWYLVYLTCPFWIIPGSIGTVLAPVLNGTLYGLIAFAFYSYRTSTAR